MVLEKTLESPLDCKEIKSVNPKGKQPWIFIGKTDAEALILWPPDVKSWLIGKDPDAGKDWGQEKGTKEDEMIGWHRVWASSRKWWRTGKPGVWVTEQGKTLTSVSQPQHWWHFGPDNWRVWQPWAVFRLLQRLWPLPIRCPNILVTTKNTSRASSVTWRAESTTVMNHCIK